MFDFESMKIRLLKSGFVDIRRCAFGDAQDPAFNAVESESRFIAGDEHELAVEATKPT
jgi:hypothetical protein